MADHSLNRGTERVATDVSLQDASVSKHVTTYRVKSSGPNPSYETFIVPVATVPLEVAQARMKAVATSSTEVYTVSNPDGSTCTVVPDKSYTPVFRAARGTTGVTISPDKDPWHGELRNTVDYYITNGYGIICHNILQTGVVISILEAKGLKLEDGIQPLAYTHIRINANNTYSRVWQLLNPRKITFDAFIK